MIGWGMRILHPNSTSQANILKEMEMEELSGWESEPLVIPVSLTTLVKWIFPSQATALQIKHIDLLFGYRIVILTRASILY